MPVLYTVSHVYCKLTFYQFIMNESIIKIKSLYLLLTIFSFHGVHEYKSVCCVRELHVCLNSSSMPQFITLNASTLLVTFFVCLCTVNSLT